MKAVSIAVVLAIATPLAAHAEDMAKLISQYRREHGLSEVRTDPQLTAMAERQAKAMAASGVMDHSVAGSFGSRVSGLKMGVAAENIAAGTKSWAETFRIWKTSPGHNANLLQSRADSVGVAVARNDKTPYKTYWAMVIAEKAPGKTDRKGTAAGPKTSHKTGVDAAASKKSADARNAKSGSPVEASENPLDAVKTFVCKYLC